MPTYTATFRTDAEFATATVQAKNPRAALRVAQALWEQNQNALVFKRYEDIFPLNEIAITSASGRQLTEWLDEDMLLRLSAEEMRSALISAVEALKSVPTFQVPSLDVDSRCILKECEAVLAQATGEGA